MSSELHAQADLQQEEEHPGTQLTEGWLGPRTSLDEMERGYLAPTETRNGTRGSVVVKALCCKPEGRGFETR
jgi:hypothetical protein